MLRAGCGRFDEAASRIVDGPSGAVAVLVASRLSPSANGPRLPGLRGPRGSGSWDRRRADGRGAFLAFARAGTGEPPPSRSRSRTTRAHRLYQPTGFSHAPRLRRARLGTAPRAHQGLRRVSAAPHHSWLAGAALAPAVPGPVPVVRPTGRAGPAQRRSGSGRRWRRCSPRALQRVGVPAVPGIDRRRAQEALGVPRRARRAPPRFASPSRSALSRLVVGSWDLRGWRCHVVAAAARTRRGAERAARGHDGRSPTSGGRSTRSPGTWRWRASAPGRDTRHAAPRRVRRALRRAARPRGGAGGT